MLACRAFICNAKIDGPKCTYILTYNSALWFITKLSRVPLTEKTDHSHLR